MQLTRMGTGHTANPRWAAGNRTILFNSWGPRSQLYTVTVADGAVTRLTDAQGNVVEASWSRDGKWIYCGSDRSGRLELYRVPASGGTLVPITRNGGLHAEESPDRKWIFYSKDANSPSSIWRVPTGGGQESMVLEGLSYSTNFAVATDGIYFVSPAAIEYYAFATDSRKIVAPLRAPFSIGIALSPDERALLYSVVDHASSNLMLVDRSQ